MINIISTFYVSKYLSQLDNERTKELVSSLQNNIKSNIVKKIHLFVDDEDSLNTLKEVSNNSDKVKVIAIQKQPTYNDFFNYILNNLKNDICMITNSDIYIDIYDERLLNLLQDNKYMYTLTRYEYDMSCPLINSYGGSHDCYIFHSKFLDNSIIRKEHTNFKQNLPGIETHIISTFCKSGFKAFNPCRQIKIVHLHKTQLRNHGQWIGLHRCGDYDFHMKNCWWVPPCVV